MIINFLCKTNSKENYLEIKRRTHLAGAHIDSDDIKEVDGGFEGIVSITAYSGSLYKEIEITNLSELELTITGGSKEIEDLKINK
jgi:hypothetical protein